MSSTGRFGQVGVGELGFSVRLDSRGILRLTDAITGRFLGGTFQKTLEEVNRKAAKAIAEGMVAELDRKIKNTGRLQTRGRRLQEALLDERNFDVTASSFIVGRPSWLDRSPAERYWRQIEQGNPKVYEWRALFTNDFGSWYGPWSPEGHSKQSEYRHMRSGGTTKLYSRPMPEGYKHSRMPQNSDRSVLMKVGPFPDYRYSRGGSQAMKRLRLGAQYRTALANVGIFLDPSAYK